MSVANEVCEVIEPHETAAPPRPVELPWSVIGSRPGWRFVDLAEVWQFRELLGFLIWRDVKVRYKQTILGAAWAILQPLAQMAVFSVFFGRMVELPTEGVPYPLFAFAGLLAWNFFGNSIGNAGNSMVGNQSLISKVYFPRLFLPASAIGVGLVDFAIAFVMLLILMLYYGVGLSLSLLITPLMVLGLAAASLGVGALLAALTVAYRDFRYVVSFMVQLWMFATPSIYMDARVVGPRWQWLLPLNPAYGLILNFRHAALGEALDWYSLSVSLTVTLVLLLVGCLYFQRVERTLADII
jgi:lipopolysaccharide transport system permease protein